MKKSLKTRVFAILMVLVLCLSLVPATALADEPETGTEISVSVTYMYGGESKSTTVTIECDEGGSPTVFSAIAALHAEFFPGDDGLESTELGEINKFMGEAVGGITVSVNGENATLETELEEEAEIVITTIAVEPPEDEEEPAMPMLSGLELYSAPTITSDASERVLLEFDTTFDGEVENHTTRVPVGHIGLFIKPVMADSDGYRWRAGTKSNDAGSVTNRWPAQSFGNSVVAASGNLGAMRAITVIEILDADNKVVKTYTIDTLRAPSIGSPTFSNGLFTDNITTNGTAKLVLPPDTDTVSFTMSNNPKVTYADGETDGISKDGNSYSVDVAAVPNDGSVDIAITATTTPAAGRYNPTIVITIEKFPLAATPSIFSQTMNSQTFVMLENGNLDAGTQTAFSVTAVASGEITYQWYVSETESSTEGTLVADATEASYKPTLELGTKYYYCVATTDSGEVSSDIARITVLSIEEATPKAELATPGETLGEVPGVTFAQEIGYYYAVDATGVMPLSVNLTDQPEGVTVGYSWAQQFSTNAYASASSAHPFTPLTTTTRLGANYYTCTVRYTVNGKSYSVILPTVYVHVQNSVDYAAAKTYFGTEGTSSAPFPVATIADLNQLRDFVDVGLDFKGYHFEMTANITLSNTWVSIGTSVGGRDYGKTFKPFSGTFDGGNKTITYESGAKPLFGCTREAVVKNLELTGAWVDGNGLLANYVIDYGVSGAHGNGKPTIIIDNVNITGSLKIGGSGFLSGDASGQNLVTISNSMIDAGVVIGVDVSGTSLDIDGVGSFAGGFNGTIINCKSAATVYGKNNVGGIVGYKAQSMGAFDVKNSEFTGSVIATGDYVGGIVGRGHLAGITTEVDSGPNTLSVGIENCLVNGNVTGASYVGGIFGGEPDQVQAWDNNTYFIRNNLFVGTLTGSSNVGGIIGHMNSLNKFNVITNNLYNDSNNVTAGIGKATYVDTSYAAPTAMSGTTYFNTATALPSVSGITKRDHNRTDDPLGANKESLTIAVTDEQVANGTVQDMLNNGEGSLGNWEIGGGSIGHDTNAVVVTIVLSGNYKTLYTVGEPFSAAGMIITATKSDGTSEIIATDAVGVSFTGFVGNVQNVGTVTVRYGAASASYAVRVNNPVALGKETITVTFSLLGDTVHDEPEADGGPHMHMKDNLETWIPAQQYTVNANSTVLEVLAQALSGAGMTWSNRGNYIESITRNGVKLAEFDNGPLSGWMYMLNGTHPTLGVEQQFVQDGDVIIFHYTDDYTSEQGSEQWKDENKAPGGASTPLSEQKELLTAIEPETLVTGGEGVANVPAADVEDAIEAAKRDGKLGISIEPKNTENVTDKMSVTLPTVSVTSLADEDLSLVIRTQLGDLTFDPDALAAIATAAAGQTVTVVAELVDNEKLSDAQREQAGDRPVVDLTVQSAGRTISDFKGGTVTVTIPYTLRRGEVAEGIKVFYMADDGTLTEVSCHYNAATKSVEFTVEHFSKYIIAYELPAVWTNPFADVSVHDWFYDAVKYVNENELMNGISSDKFEPHASLTRAMLITILYRSEGEPTVTQGIDFTDVPSGQWYTDAITWASANGIAQGYGSGEFAPNDSITREQLAAILFRFAKYKELDTAKSADISRFEDASQVSDWALDAMSWANAEELITGRSVVTLAPSGTATRAEAATLLMRFLENYAKA